MQVVYLFCDSSFVHIPLLDYDKKVFNMIASKVGGYWDKAKQEFTFKRNTGGYLDREEFKEMFSNIPTVWVETNAPAKVSGFLDREWRKTATELYEKSEKAKKRACFPLTDNEGKPLPEKFSQYWQVNLDTEMRARKYSNHTRKNYVYYNSLLCRITQKTVEEIQADDITKFLASMERTGEYSASTMNFALSAFRFFYKNVMRNNITRDHYRPRLDKKLPIVLSKNEIMTIFKEEKNLKHRLLLMIVFASGLRVSEVVCLKHKDLDIDRKVISIIAGKGRKDRCSLLAQTVLDTLFEYYKRYEISENATEWIFPSTDQSKHLTIRTAQNIFTNAVKKTNIQKDCSIHCLRHSFATHLLESGTDIRYIQELLGHSSIRTTERYTHVARRKVLKIASPLDRITEPDD